MLNSEVSRYRHWPVTLQFFETIVRYDRFFNLEPQYIPNVLVSTLPVTFESICTTANFFYYLHV